MIDRIRTMLVVITMVLMLAPVLQAAEHIEEVHPVVPGICFTDVCFELEIANTPEARKQGLMFRDELLPSAGMLFVFDEEGEHGFWMKNMEIPLDIIWLDQDFKVVHIAQNVPPCAEDPCPTYLPGAPASYVLEISSGLAKEKGIAPGAQATLQFP